MQAGVYASVLHYLKAVDKVGGAVDGKAVVAAMKAMPTDDPLFGKGTIRADGRKLHPMYLLEVKKPDESTIEMGSAEGRRNHSRRPGVSSRERRQLPAGQEVTSLANGRWPFAELVRRGLVFMLPRQLVCASLFSTNGRSKSTEIARPCRGETDVRTIGSSRRDASVRARERCGWRVPFRPDCRLRPRLSRRRDCREPAAAARSRSRVPACSGRRAGGVRVRARPR